MSFGEPIALRGQVELESAALRSGEARPTGEQQFIERLKAGEVAAFERLVNERTGDIYALLHTLTQDQEEARDLTQETFLQAFRCVKHFRGDSSIRTWLYRIAVNRARNRWRWWRRRRRESTISLDCPCASGREQTLKLSNRTSKTPESEAIARERERMLGAALESLARPYREVVFLRDLEGLSYDEVATALEISVGTVKSRLSRARTELRRRLERCMG